MDKTYPDIDEAIADIEDGAMIAVAGFFSAGVPRHLLRALIRKKVKNLTLACGSGPLLGATEEGRELVENNQVKKVIDSYGLPRSGTKGKDNPLENKIRNGEIELEIYPMGTLAEKYRAGGAGIPAFYVKTGIGTVVAQSSLSSVDKNRSPKETRSFNGEEYIMEYALQPDYAFIHAHTADKEGNLVYQKTARNFNHVMAMAGRITIAEAEKIIEPGDIDPNHVHTSGIFIQRLLEVERLDFEIAID